MLLEVTTLILLKASGFINVKKIDLSLVYGKLAVLLGFTDQTLIPLYQFEIILL